MTESTALCAFVAAWTMSQSAWSALLTDAQELANEALYLAQAG